MALAASRTWTLYSSAIPQLRSGSISLGADTFKAVLLSTGYDPSSGVDDQRADVAAYALSTDQTVLVSVSGEAVSINTAVQWTGNGSVAPKHVAIYDDTTTNKELLCVASMEGAQLIPSSTTFTLPAQTLFRLSNIFITPPLPDISSYITTFENYYETAGDNRYSSDLTAWSASEYNYYDRAYAWYALGYNDTRAQTVADNYQAGVDAGNPPPRDMQPDGLVEYYVRSSDSTILTTLKSMADTLKASYVDGNYVKPAPDSNPERWAGRIQERALLAAMACDYLNVPTPTYNYANVATEVKDAILATQEYARGDTSTAVYPEGLSIEEGAWYPPVIALPQFSLDEDNLVSSNFMGASACSALMRYAEYYGTDVTNIQAAVERGLDFLWQTQWRESDSDPSFNYYSPDRDTVRNRNPSGLNGGPNPTRDLNLFYLDAFGWMYYKTGDTKWISRGDEIFTTGIDWNSIATLQASSNFKQYNQFIRNSWRYLYYRNGYTIGLQNSFDVV